MQQSLINPSSTKKNRQTGSLRQQGYEDISRPSSVRIFQKDRKTHPAESEYFKKIEQPNLNISKRDKNTPSRI